jgi:hypothetical protein
MTTQLLFYERITPISRDRHKDWSIDGTEERYHFAEGVNSVPVTAVEIPLAARDYTIVFAGQADSLVPVAILGVEGNENLYVTAEGNWDARYIPAFVRRYPFVFARSDDRKTFTLCLDESWAGCNQEGRGERLFDAEGNQTPYVDRVVEFLKDYQNHFARTQVYCQKLQELELLEPKQARVTLGDGRQRSLTGFLAVNRDKLKALPPEKLAELARTDELELTYLHLQSMNNFGLTARRAADRAAAGKSGAGTSRELPPAGPWPARRMAARGRARHAAGSLRDNPAPVR